MTRNQARLWLMKYSLAASLGVFAFFLLAPTVGYPLRFDQALRLIEITTPVFLGYLGAGAQYLVGRDRVAAAPRARRGGQGESALFALMVRGPVVMFSAVIVTALLAFYLSNRPTAVPGSGMSVDNLALVVTAALGFLTVATNVLISHLFQSEAKGESDPKVEAA